MSWFVALGLSLLYGSAYYLPLLSPTEAYFIPSTWTYIVLPTLIVAAILSPAAILADHMVANRDSTRSRTLLAWAICSLLVVMAINSTLAAADYSLDFFIAPAMGTEANLMRYRWLRIAVPIAELVCVAAIMWAFRGRLRQTMKFLSLLGFAFAALAVVRIVPHPPASHAPVPEAARTASAPPPQTSAARRVVWIIFDELDYDETFGADTAWAARALPNLIRLRGQSVSATQAYSPAKDTEESLPALLMSAPVRGSRFAADGTFWVSIAGASSRRFAQEDTVFARLPGGPQSAAVLGYYHPYCKILFAVGSCRSFYLGNAGRWFDGLLFFSNTIAGLIRWIPAATTGVPDQLLQAVDPMFRISTEMARTAPALLAQSAQALVFVHYNIPHYPAAMAQRTLNLRADPGDQASYRDNLLLVDRVIGQIMAQVSTELRSAPGQELLLVLSSDHWHRMNSLTTARRIPFLAWHVSESEPVSMPQPISTLHTADLIVDFLEGKITTHAEIARWWQGKPLIPTWIPDNQKF